MVETGGEETKKRLRIKAAPKLVARLGDDLTGALSETIEHAVGGGVGKTACVSCCCCCCCDCGARFPTLLCSNDEYVDDGAGIEDRFSIRHSLFISCDA